ncbi:hypothetical protein D0T49_11620 [Paludibacter sp. 221]|uniref:hypothetical protein n=1 Tax=Paludibacter sp. 221 TaxID=2302939 RepID=UPI0013D604E7|nr:hypothetical protein [Paludibacter sp. 221]NDV47695.1 hypothetical protein [Paludibacter sp. 221]
MSKRKINLYIIIVLLHAVVFTACNNNISSIPDAPVNVRLNLVNYINLYAAGEYVTFTERNPAIGVYDIGYGGVLIYAYVDINSGGSVIHAAFDMCCPYEKDKNIKVSVSSDESNLSAVCKECGSTFNLNWGQGYVEKGPAKESLKPFTVSRNGDFLIVTPKYR